MKLQEVKKLAVGAIESEIKWHMKNTKEASHLSSDYKRGFLKGLRQARGTIKLALCNTANRKEQSD